MENKIRMAFEPVKASPELKEKTGEFLRKAAEKRSARRFPMPALAAAAAALLLTVGLGLFLRLPVAYVSIDVNPSLELGLNRMDRIVSVRSFNEDGARVLEGLSLRGMLYTDAIDRLLSSGAMAPYLTDSSALTFTVAAEEKEKENALLTGIRNTPGCKNHGGESCGADLSTLETAHDLGFSFGKYAVYLTLAEYDSTVTPESCHSMSMSQLRARIRQHQDGSCGEDCHGATEDSGQETGEHTGTGNGNGSGAGNGNGNGAGNGNGSGAGNGHGNGSGNCSDSESESCDSSASELCSDSDRETGACDPPEKESEPCDDKPASGDCAGAGSVSESGGNGSDCDDSGNGSHNGQENGSHGNSGHGNGKHHKG